MPAMPFSPCPAGGQCTDVSVGILRRIFGPVIDALASGADPGAVSQAASTLGSMLSVFNSGLLVVASLIVSFIAVTGAVNTANDGEAMGKSWSSVWTPLRVVTGASFLLPSASGFSFIQHLVLMLALWGVGLANSVFDKGVQAGIVGGALTNISAQAGYGNGAKPSESFPLYDVRKFAQQYLALSYCAYSANKIYDDSSRGGNAPAVQAGATPDVTAMEDKAGAVTSKTFLIRDRNAATSLAGGAPFCGTVKVYAFNSAPVVPTNNDDLSQTLSGATAAANQTALQAIRVAATSAKQAALVQLMKDIDAWVATMPYSLSQPGWDTVSSQQFNIIVDNAQQAVLSNLSSQIANDTTLSQIMQGWTNSVTKDGWAMAGGFHQRLGGIREEMAKIYSSAPADATAPTFSGLPDDARAQMLANGVDTASRTIIAKADAGAGALSGTPSPAELNSVVPDSLSGLNVDSLRSGFDSRMTKFVNWSMQGTTEILIGTDAGVDAISRIKRVGDWMTVLSSMTLAADTALKTAITGLRAAAGVVGSVKVAGTGVDLTPVGTAVWDWSLAVVVPQLAKMMSWLDLLAFYFGTFLPSLPYGIFMVVVAGWVLAVLQSVIAAPLWVVMHMRPSQTFIGSDQQGYLLLLSLFVRPALAVLGLFAGILAADPIVDYLAKAFFSMRTAIVTSQESLGWVVEFMTYKDWMVVFGFILLPVVYMIFGLPQVLPDHVLKWIGAGVADLGETNATHMMRGNMERAALSSSGTPPVSLPRQRGGGASDGAGSPSGPRLPPSGGRERAGRERGNTTINAGLQGVAPPAETEAHTAEMATAPPHSTRPALMGGGQGTTPELDEKPAATGNALTRRPSTANGPINASSTQPPEGDPT
ncbi:DotA/TraY family protein [uncultured Variovorax sp.]|jgi:conjugal transfer/type IV secretion protein DotA/TraY|uniref:DotA/TraY family protein n=1 Tax=uncultured Variovorax sp. TaxID=114708 RepID=UPI00261BF3F5|nr:DotA/TraY family protein [uncultured Variovorax sp.]